MNLARKIKYSVKDMVASIAKKNGRYFLKLQRDYKDLALKYADCESTKASNKIVWLFWWDGFEQLPPLCRACFDSVKRYIRKDFGIIFIDKKNYLEYVDLPKYIIKKHDSGIISHTHFSDILRACLLCEHGGLWLDASVYLTGSICQDVYDSDLFVFKGSSFKNINCEEDGSNISNWFIYSNKDHPIMLAVKDMLFRYWEKNNTIKEYFIFHWFFTIAARENIKEWYKIPYYPNVLPHYLFFTIFDKPYNNDDYIYATKLSNIHKLSWHCSPKEGSFHQTLIIRYVDK